MKYKLSSFSEDELRAELKRRNDEKKPKPLGDPDFTDLIDLCDTLVISNIHEKGWYCRSSQELVFTRAMACVYGENIVKYIECKEY